MSRGRHLLAQATKAAGYELNARTCPYCIGEVEVEWKDTRKGRRPFDAGTNKKHVHRQSPVKITRLSPDEMRSW